MLDLIELARYFGRHWKLVAFIFVLCIAAGAIYLQFATPLYRAQVTMQYVGAPQQGEGMGGALGVGLALAGLQSEKAIPERARAFGVLRSRAFVLPVIHQLNLAPRIFPRKYDISQKNWRPNVRPPTEDELFQSFNGRILEVDDSTSTGLVTLSILLPSAREVGVVANTLVSRLNEELRDDLMSQASNNIDYLNKQLAQSQVAEVRSAIAQLVQSEMRRMILTSNESTYAFRVIDPAVQPDKPYAPRTMLVIVFALLLAALLAGFIVIALFLFRNATND